MEWKVRSSTRPLSETEIDKHNHWVLLVPSSETGFSTSQFPYASQLIQRLKRQGEKKWPRAAWTADLPNPQGSRITLAALKPNISAFDLLTLARQLIAPHLAAKAVSIGVACADLDPELARRCGEALLAAAYAGSFALPSYKREQKKQPRSAELVVHGVAGIDTTRISAEAHGNNLARRLTSMPPNTLNPATYLREIRTLAKQNGWAVTFLDQRRLKQLGAGAFLAVAQGSENRDAGIVHLRYEPKGRSRRGTTAPRLALVGKGICFDTGGNNLKPAKSMHGMHEDMEGSAVALGSLLALTELKVDFPIDCWLALSENLIGPRAYKQNAVVTAADGTSIEIVHTDAEGRMVLADTLYLASREKPALIVDYATLTGSCVYALSTRYSGAFTNRPQWLPPIIQAGLDSGERVWPFPMDEDFDSELDSAIADVKQCTLAGEADHILAARFLNRFVKDRPWVHIDLSAGNNKGGLAHVPSDITGFGVRFTLNLLLDKQLMATA